MQHNVDLKDFKGRKGFDNFQHQTLCWIGFMGFVAFRIVFCYTLLLIRYGIWLAGESLRNMPGSILDIGGLVANVLIAPIDGILKLAINIRDPKTGDRIIPKWRIIPDTFKAARMTPRMYRNGWTTIAVVCSYGGIKLLERFTG